MDTLVDRSTSLHGRVVSAALFLISLIALNALLTAHAWFPERLWLGVLSFSVESLLIIVVIGAVAYLPPRIRRPAIVLHVLLAACVAVFSGGEALMRYVYGRGFEPRTDLDYLASGARLLFPEISLPDTLLTGLLVLFLSAAAVAAVALPTMVVFRAAGKSGRRGGAALAIVLLVAATPIVGFSEPLSDDIVAGLRPAQHQSRSHALTELPQRDDADEPREGDAGAGAGAGALSGIGNRDIYLFFVESYGRALFTRPGLRDALLPFLRESERTIKGAGYAVRSSFLRSPVAGGWSWLAEASFLTGRNIRDDARYEELLASDSMSIPRYVREAGYHTTLVMPAVEDEDWPEGREFYGFDELHFAPFYDYGGPRYEFSRVPDQVAIYQTFQHVNEGHGGVERPHFVEYVLTSSHAPFSRIPPYIDDWSSIGDGTIYNELEGQNFDNGYFAGEEYDSGYAAAIRYVLTAIRTHLIEQVTEPSVVIIVGDHQPMRPIRAADGARAVPIHVLSRDEQVLSPLDELGYEATLLPQQEPPHAGMHDFFAHFLKVAGRDK